MMRHTTYNWLGTLYVDIQRDTILKGGGPNLNQASTGHIAVPSEAQT